MQQIEFNRETGGFRVVYYDFNHEEIPRSSPLNPDEFAKYTKKRFVNKNGNRYTSKKILREMFDSFSKHANDYLLYRSRRKIRWCTVGEWQNRGMRIRSKYPPVKILVSIYEEDENGRQKRNVFIHYVYSRAQVKRINRRGL